MIDRPTRYVLAGSSLMFVTGIWWGWPDAVWAPDELRPSDVLAGLEHGFHGNWSGIYAPLHFYVLTLAYAPLLLLERAGWIVDRDPALQMTGRLVSVLLALGTQAVIAVLAGRLWGRAHAWPAALSAGMFLPIVYYAKTVNVDMAYVFWFAVSLLCFAEAYANARVRATLGFGVSAALAVCTKDQAYALYLLPGLLLASRLVRSPAGRRALAGGGIAFVATFLLVYNVVWNPTGLRDHIATVTGAASVDYRMFPATLDGQMQLAQATASQLWWTLGVPGLILAAIGSVVALRTAPRLLWLFAAPLSYYLGFIAVVGYVYDRFLMPVAVVAALLAAVGVRAVADAPQLAPAVRRASVTLLLSWLVWRAASVDALLVNDSRYAAEAWLRDHVGASEWVASIDQRGYLPRLDRFRHRVIAATAEATATERPHYIVINREHLERYPPSSPRRLWMDWLRSPESGYLEVFRDKHPLTWSALRWDTRFTDRVEDPFTNLDKANPEIVIFAKITK